MRRGAKPSEAQGMLLFEKRQIPKLYDTELADKAIQRRRKRTGYLALHKGLRPIERKFGFIPASGTENSALAKLPEPKIRQDTWLIRELVKEKYAPEKYSGKPISDKRIRQWANMAAMNAEAKLRGKYFTWLIDARKQRIALEDGLNEDRSFDHESITSSEMAMNALAWYVVRLEAFTGEREKTSQGYVMKRKWIQERWTRVVAERKTSARQYLLGLPEYRLGDMYEEAVYDAWNRDIFWYVAWKSHSADLDRRRKEMPVYIEIPMVAYEQSPEYRGIEISQEYY